MPAQYRIAEYGGRALIQRKRGWWRGWETWEHFTEKWCDNWSVERMATEWKSLYTYVSREMATRELAKLLNNDGKVKYTYVDVVERL